MAKIKQPKPLTAPELAAWFESLVMLLRAGVPVNECPGIIAADMENERLSHAAESLDSLLNSGNVFVLSKAMEETGIFPSYALEMIRLGEDTGRLDVAADSLGDYYRHQSELFVNIRSALTSPVLLLVMMAMVLFVLILFVLPVYSRVFEFLGISMNSGLGNAYFASHIIIGIVGGLLLLCFLLGLLFLWPTGRATLIRASEILPFTRRIHYAISASRLTHGLQMLLSSGIGNSEALKKATTLVNNNQLTKAMPPCIEAVESGQDLGHAMMDTGVLHGFEAKILISASRAGQIDVAMGHLSNVYSAQANASIDRLVSIIEPVLVGFLSIAIGAILLSVMLPLTNIMSALN